MARTEQEVSNAIQVALRVIEEASVPDDLRGLAFEKAFDSLTETASKPDNPGVEEQTGMVIGASDRSVLERAAAKLRLDARDLERVLDFDDDGVHIIVPRSRLARQKSAAIQQVATLIVGARQAAGLEEWTSQNLVRQATEELGVEDPSNFATHMKRLEGIRLRGSGKTGELKMNAVGYEATSGLIRDIAHEAPT